MDRIDLHVHTTASDGTETPTEVVQQAAALGLRAIAITDHDTVAGCREGAEAAARCGIELIPGLEISTKFHSAVHILGYCIDTNAPSLTEVMDWEIYDRDARNERICALMAADGLPVSYDMMRERFGVAIGRQAAFRAASYGVRPCKQRCGRLRTLRRQGEEILPFAKLPLA